MSVNIIDTLKPKNGLSFPVVEAIDVFVENYGNLAEAVSHFATDVMIEAINTVLSGKANTSDVNTAVANLQGQIDQIVISASAESVVAPEVAAARVDAEGVSFATLKERLDKHDSLRKELFEDITITDNIYIKFNTGAEQSSTGYCATGFIPTDYPIVVKTKVSEDQSGISFYNANKNFISGSGYNPASDNETEVTLTPPANAAYVRISCLKSYKNSFTCRYNKALTTIEGKITGLNSEITELNTEIQATNKKIDNLSKVDYEVVESSYININTGSRATNVPAYFSTEYILLDADINVRTKVGNDLSGICFYNENKAFISGYNPYSDNETEVTLEPPEGAIYVRITCATNYADQFLCHYKDLLGRVEIEISEVNDEISDLENDISPLTELDNTNYEVVESSYINYSTGSRASNVSAYFSTEYVPLTYPVIVKTKVSNDLSGICFYDASKRFISGYNPYDDNETEVTLEPPEGAVYVRISCFTNYASKFVCKYKDVLLSMKESVGDIQEFIDKNASNIVPTFWAQAMWKVLCIGDSLTSGANYTEEWGEQTSPGASIDQNYPRMLGRLINGEVTNAGFSGYSASTWWNSKRNSYTYNDYDTFIIWLGTNNGLTDTLDTDVDPYDDYNDFAETETGYYCKIIEKIKEENESCLIVLTKIFASKDSVSETNTTIDHIAEKYNLPVIDNSDLGAGAHPELHGGINNPHFGKAGNAFVANRYVARTSEWFAENPLRCEYHYTPRTN